MKIQLATTSKLIEFMTQLKGLKFVTTLVLVFKNIEIADKASMTVFIQAEKQNYLSMKVTLMKYFNHSILQL